MLNPSFYSKYVIYNSKWVPLFYVNMNKALYGLLKSALLFYKNLRVELDSIGFLINPYDPFFPNHDINITQMTITWHVSYLKVSHKDAFEITEFVMGL